MLAKDIVRPIEEFAPLALQESWDNCGFSVGNPDREAKSALIALDCTEEVLDEAIEMGCDIIITHHPLIFKGLKSITPADMAGRIVSKAIKHDISIYAAHTNADKVLEGVSGAMAARLGLKNVTVLDPDGEETGLGAVGDLPEPISAEQAAALVKEKFALKSMKASKPVDGMISRVAMCGGSGGSLIAAARKSGAQLYISGDISYHNFFTPEGFMIMDIGHYCSEYDVVSLFANILCENFPNFAVLKSRRNNNPIYYY